MTRTPKAIVKPDVLEWARRSVDMSVTDAARKMGQSETKIEEWESGVDSPTVAQLRLLSEIYKRPLAVFFLPGPPKTFDALRDFRLLSLDEAVSWSPTLHFEFRRAREQREAAIELAQRSDDQVPTDWHPSESFDDRDPEALGETMRRVLGVSIAVQQTWTDQYRALGGWIHALEDAGVLVIQTDRIELNEMRGFSIYADEYPIIAINGKDFTRGKTFSLLHEFAHLLLRQSGLCDQVSDRVPTSDDRQLEAFCNYAAAAALMPATTFLAEPVVMEVPDHFEGWESNTLAILSRLYGASEEAILRRLLTLGKTTQRYYQRRRTEYLKIYADEAARRKEEQKESPGGPTYYRIKARNLGKGYVRLISHAYAREVIDTLEAANYLGVKVQHLAKLADEAFGKNG